MATEREHNDRTEEGMRLTRFDGPPEF